MATIIHERKSYDCQVRKCHLNYALLLLMYIAILNPFYSGLCMKRFNYFELILKRVILARMEYMFLSIIK